MYIQGAKVMYRFRLFLDVASDVLIEIHGCAHTSTGNKLFCKFSCHEYRKHLKSTAS